MIVTLQGGLGNQMFQYAFGRSVAIARQEELFFTRYRVDGDTKRKYMLRTDDICFVDHEAEPLFQENPFCFNPLVYQQPTGTSFIGHWQTEKYFNISLVRSIFMQHKPTIPSACFLHVRRADYLSPENISYHGLCPTDYYRQAMKLVPTNNFHIFSDDPDWCQEQFPNVVIVRNMDEHDTLQAMASCQHAIIANSSFSWWGAWMGDDKVERVVIAPRKWFATPTLDSRDICPDRWILL